MAHQGKNPMKQNPVLCVWQKDSEGKNKKECGLKV